METGGDLKEAGKQGGQYVDESIASADMDFNQLEAFLTAQTKKQGGITGEQAAVISKFWKSHKTRIRESLLNQSRWDNGLRGLSWRVDGKSQSRHAAQIHTPAAIVELEFGKSGQLPDQRAVSKQNCSCICFPMDCGPEYTSQVLSVLGHSGEKRNQFSPVVVPLSRSLKSHSGSVQQI
ncbi:COMM domain-containing protein 1 [Microtus ochrogaster]|uniref:COMM domain-containing protein 1 n=1 Tax=Microtus ochrogaster TaxID=79684 RepID=A0A8J6H2K3_MICOH|nr:COMM domain-containing protein 1 [Microtus ochrogaster]